MAHHLKKKEYHFTLGTLFRLVIFIMFVYFSISFLSGGKSNLNTDLSTQNINILGVNSQPVIIKAQDQFNSYRQQATDFINQQIIDLKKQLLTQIYQDMLKSIEGQK